MFAVDMSTNVLRRFRIAVKFCGHCKPALDMHSFYCKLQDMLPEADFYYYVTEANVDLLLIMNACSEECSSVPDFPGQVLFISPDSVNHWIVKKNELLDTACSAIKGYIQMAREMIP